MNSGLSGIVFFLVFCTLLTNLSFAETETANEIGDIRVDKDLYEIIQGKNTEVKISGTVSNYVNNARITILITDPNGMTDGLNIVPQENGYFEATWNLSEKSVRGIYEMMVTYHSAKIGTISFSVKDKEFSQDEILAARGISKTQTESPVQNATETQNETQNEPESDSNSSKSQSDNAELKNLDHDSESKQVESKSEVSANAGILRIDKTVKEVTFGNWNKVVISGQVDTWAWSRSGSATTTIVITTPNGKIERLTASVDKETGNFEAQYSIGYYSQRGIYKVSGFYENRCPYMKICQPVDPVDFGMLSFLIRGEILDDKPLQVQEYGPYDKGLELYQQGKYKEALVNFEQALKKDPNNSDIQNYVNFSKTRVNLETKCKQRSSYPYDQRWFESASECCLLSPPNKVYDCQQGIMYQQINWMHEKGIDPMEQAMRDQNERIRESDRQAQIQRQESFQNLALPSIAVGIGIIMTVALVLRSKKSKKSRTSLKQDKRNERSGSDDGWKGI